MGRTPRGLYNVPLFNYGGYKLPFFERKIWRLNIPTRRESHNLIAQTNVSDDDMTVFSLAKLGYGSIKEIKEMDTKEFFDLVEFEQISGAIERHYMDEARRGN